jgi:hypothetical protein
MEVGRQAYLDARDRALDGVVSAKTFDAARSAWRLAKAHNRCAKEKCREEARTAISAGPLAGHARVRGSDVGGARDGGGV